jgi:hypothetical protein
MTLTYTWKLTGLAKKNITELGIDNAVIQTYWECQGEDAEGNIGVFTGATPLKNPDPESFTPYESLTEAMVLEWIMDEVITDDGIYWSHVQDRITAQIEAKKIESVSTDQLPWNGSE